MKIGIVGTGYIGATAARLFVRAGHEVALSNSRGGEGLAELIGELGDRARATSVAQAARFGTVVLVAVPFGRYEELPTEAFDGKVVIDAGNYYPDRDGHVPELDADETTSSELVAGHLRGARLVKAFNTIYFRHLATEGRTDLPEDDRRAIFVASDDPAAKSTVAALIRQLGFAAVDAGTLHDGRHLEPGSPVYNQQMSAREARERLATLTRGA